MRRFEGFKFRSFLLWTTFGFIAAPRVIRLFVQDDNLFGELTASAFYLAAAVWLVCNFYAGQIELSRLFGPFPQTRDHWSCVALFLPLAGFGYGTLFLIGYLLSFFAPSLVEAELSSSQDMPVEYLQWTGIGLYRMLEAAIIAPVIEEILFRGVLLHRWAERWSVKTSVVVSSFLFALLHMQVVGAIGNFVFGAVLAGVYLHTRSLLVPIFIHILNNSVIVITSMFLKEEPAYTVHQLYADAWTGWIALFISVPWLMWFVYSKRQAWSATAPYYA